MTTRKVPFLEVFEDESGGNIKTPQSEYLPVGKFPVVDQGKALIAGYVDDVSRLCGDGRPAIVFGDHTRCVKYADFPFCMGADGVKVLRPKVDADLKYLYYFLRQLDIPNAGYDRHFKYLKRTEVVLQPLPDQRRIAAILDQADALRAKRREALAQLDSLTQSIFIEMFGDPVLNPKGWEKVSLTKACESPDDIRCGPFGTQLLRSEFKTEGVPLWGIKNVNARFEIPTHEFVDERTAKRLSQYSIEPMDIVMTRKGTVGNCAVYPEDFPVGVMHSDLLRLRISPRLGISAFLNHQLHNSQDVARQMELISGGAVMPGINVSRLKNLLVLLPPLSLQKNFSTRVHSVKSLKVTHRAALQELDRLFASLQHRAFQGEL